MPLGYQSKDIFGVKVTPTTTDDLLALIEQSVTEKKKTVIVSMNMHGMYKIFSDDKFRALHLDPGTCVHIDGTPIIWLGKISGLDLDYRHRTGWIDWFLPLMRKAEEHRWRVYYLGSTEEVVETGIARLRQEFQQLSITGHHGYFDATPGSQGNDNIIRCINESHPDILIVGMGMGRQEHWVLASREAVEAICIACSGACMEYFAGTVPTAPRWMGPLGLEWLFRLLSDPARFWKRYLVEPWVVLWFVLRDSARRRKAARGGTGEN